MPPDDELDVEKLDPNRAAAQGAGDQDDENQDDQGDEGDDGADEGQDDQGDEGQDDDQGDPPPRAARSERATRRISAQQERIHTQDRELAELRQRLDRMASAQHLPQQQAETPQQRDTRRALLTPAERIEEDLRDQRAQHANDMSILQFQLVDGSDRAAFEAKATVDPLYKRWASKVESKLNEMRNHPDPRQRANVPREALFKFMLGEAALEARQKTPAKREREQARTRVQNNNTRSNNNRSDVQAQRGRQSSVEKRLENVNI